MAGYKFCQKRFSTIVPLLAWWVYYVQSVDISRTEITSVIWQYASEPGARQRFQSSPYSYSIETLCFQLDLHKSPLQDRVIECLIHKDCRERDAVLECQRTGTGQGRVFCTMRPNLPARRMPNCSRTFERAKSTWSGKQG